MENDQMRKNSAVDNIAYIFLLFGNLTKIK